MKTRASKSAGNKGNGRKKTGISLTAFRSRVTNGRDLFHGVDERSAWCRRYRDLLHLHLADMGGEANISESEKSILRRASMMELQLEMLESKFAQNEGGIASAADLQLYQRVANSCRRMLESVGLERRARDITPSLEEYAETIDADDVEVLA